MGTKIGYKQYSRVKREANVDTDFSKGMMFTENVVDEGYVKTLVNYNFLDDKGTLTPRAGLRTSELLLPDLSLEHDEDYFASNVSIKAAKECVEKDGNTYRQIILGKLDNDSEKTGKLWVVTALKEKETIKVNEVDENELDYLAALSLATEASKPNYVAPETRKEFEIGLSVAKVSSAYTCNYLSTPLTSIHNLELVSETNNASLIGCFGFGNNYYFINDNGMYRSVFNENVARYVVEQVPTKELTVSESVTYGYNMLSETPYAFTDKVGASTILQLEGILPYDNSFKNSEPQLLMTPRRNQNIWFRCYYNVPELGTTYKFVWEWRETSASDWVEIKTETVTFTEALPILEADFKPPAKDIMIRIQAFKDGEDTIEKAMTVGFDFSEEKYGLVNNLEQKNYDLTTATGMTYWKNRMVLWGITEDPTILFVSDLNEPGYFPYPNNISVFDEPIIDVKEYMDDIMVFTASKIYRVSCAEEGSSWTSTLIQANLNIEVWDKHLTQVVRNMLFFKSGNYYYMIVPKATSTTGELTLAPISNPLNEFFNTFEHNVIDVLEETFDDVGELSLINYYNFLDYEDIHNIYVMKVANEEENQYLHLDILYNTVSRHWRIHTYEAPHLLYPYKHDATQTGVLASTSTMNVQMYSGNTVELKLCRTLQFYSYDKELLKDYYIPQSVRFIYNPEFDLPTGEDEKLSFLFNDSELIDGEVLSFPTMYVSKYTGGVLYLANKGNHIEGFNFFSLIQTLEGVDVDSDSFFKFKNWQYLDTGFRNDLLQVNKRFREIQLHLNNISKQTLSFSMDFMLDGETRKVHKKYVVEQSVDEDGDNTGICYIDATPYLNIPGEVLLESNNWTLNQDLFPEVGLWRVRVPVSGKGASPRVKLVSKNEEKFLVLGINWISRLMNMR